MMRSVKWFSAVLAMTAFTGYAHAYSVRPDLDKITREPSAARIDAKVVYYISPKDLDQQVTFKGPEGATVQYQPYKDIEAGFHKMLTNVFTDVSRIETPNPAQSTTFTYVIRMSLTTTSSKLPDGMALTLDCTIDDENGKQAASIRVVGEGKPTSGDASLAGQHAAEQALMKMQKALLAAPRLQQ